MPFELTLPNRLNKQGWKVKIREKERLEPPHVTVLCGLDEWRISLHDESFLVPPGGTWSEIHNEVRQAMNDNWTLLQEEWDKKYPSNPISSVEDDHD